MIRVVLVDDHKLVRIGIRKILEGASDIEVIGEADSGEEGVRLAEKLRPDMVLMDKFMPGIGGLEASRRILAKDLAKVVCLTVNATGPLPRRALDLGVHGFLTKSCAPEEMIEGVRRVHGGERFLSAEIARQLAQDSLTAGKSRNAIDNLSERELQVLMMLAQGHSPGDISNRLALSPKTVSTYRSRIFQKLDADSDVELVRIAMRHGLVDPEPRSVSG